MAFFSEYCVGFVVIQTVIKNEELLNRQRKLNRVEEMLNAFRRKLVVLGRIETSEEVRYAVLKRATNTITAIYREHQARL